MKQEIKERLKDLKTKGIAYKDIRLTIIDEFGEDYTENHLAVEYFKLKQIDNKTNDPLRESYEINTKGETIVEKIIELSQEELLDKNVILSKMVEDPSKWELSNFKISNWQQHTKSEGTKNLYATKITLVPGEEKITEEQFVESIIKTLEKEIKPFKFKKQPKQVLDSDLLLEFPAIELHLGKLAWGEETNANYDYKIASERFKQAINELTEIQQQEKASELVYYIGNDFFNSEANQKTTKDTPQQNDVRWQKMFEVGLDLQLEALYHLRQNFNKVNVRIVPGNHDRQMTYFLYIALKQAFKGDNIVEFSNNHKLTQVFEWGDCVIFTNHGDANYNRLVKSIPVEFAKEWGNAKYRELHLGHLHTQLAFEEAGMVSRRISSPSGIDFWHYENRFNSSLAGHQIFLWDKVKGLEAQYFVNYGTKKKSKTLVKK